MELSGKLRSWLCISVVLAVAGALLLYPIGSGAANAVFVLIKIGMVSGLLILLFGKKRGGFFLWALCSAGAICMTILKWIGLGQASFLLIGSIIVDFAMPVIAWNLMREIILSRHIPAGSAPVRR